MTWGLSRLSRVRLTVTHCSRFAAVGQGWIAAEALYGRRCRWQSQATDATALLFVKPVRSRRRDPHKRIVRVGAGLGVARDFAQCAVAVLGLGWQRCDQFPVIGHAPDVALAEPHQRAVLRSHGRNVVQWCLVGDNKARHGGTDGIAAPPRCRQAAQQRGRRRQGTAPRAGGSGSRSKGLLGCVRSTPLPQYALRILRSLECPVAVLARQRLRRGDCLNLRNTLCLALDFLKGR